MASDEIPTPTDIKPHESTYSGFLTFAKWGTIASIISVIVVIYALVS